MALNKAISQTIRRIVARTSEIRIVSRKTRWSRFITALPMVPKISLRHMVRLTSRSRFERSRDTCHASVDGIRIRMDDKGIYKEVNGTVLCEVVPHKTIIRIYHHVGKLPDDPAEMKELMGSQKGTFLWNRPAWVTCDCDDFTFVHETALRKYFATDIIHSNGEYPRETNPRMLPSICVSGDSIIETTEGAIPARDCHKRLRLVTHFSHSRAATRRKTGKLPSVRVYTDKGFSLVSTLSKDFLTVDDDMFLSWKPANELKRGDILCLNGKNAHFPDRHKVRYNDTDVEITPEIGRLLGYMTAEGSDVAFSNSSRELLDDFMRCCRASNIRHGKLVRQTPGKDCVIKSNVDCFSLRISTYDIPLLEKFGWSRRNKAAKKEVPTSIFRSPKAVVENFIAGYWEGDGSVNSNGGTLTGTTRSIKLARQIQLLLLRLGIFSSVKLYRNSGINKKNMYLVRVTGSEAIKFAESIPAIRGWRAKRFCEIVDRKDASIGKSNKSVPFNRKWVDRFDLGPVVMKTGASVLSPRKDELLRWHILSSSTDYKPDLERTYIPHARGGGLPETAFSAVAVNDMCKEGKSVCLECGKVIATNVIYHISRKHGLDAYLQRFSPHVYKAKRALEELGLDDKYTVKKRKSISIEHLSKFADAVRGLDPLFHYRVNTLKDLGYYFVRVSAIKRIRDRVLYNFEVEKDESFVANGFVVHNCKHALALAPLAVNLARKPGRGPARQQLHPAHRGRLPTHLKEMLEKKIQTPTEEEITQALRNVRDFL